MQIADWPAEEHAGTVAAAGCQHGRPCGEVRHKAGGLRLQGKLRLAAELMHDYFVSRPDVLCRPRVRRCR